MVVVVGWFATDNSASWYKCALCTDSIIVSVPLFVVYCDLYYRAEVGWFATDNSNCLSSSAVNRKGDHTGLAAGTREHFVRFVMMRHNFFSF